MGKRGNRSLRRQQQRQATEACTGATIDDTISNQPNNRQSIKATKENEDANSSTNTIKKSLGLTVTLEGEHPFSIPPPLSLDNWMQEEGKLQQAWNFFEKKREKQQQQQISPTPIQLQSWPILVAGSPPDLIGIAPTGSGKTLSYGLPIIARAQSECNTIEKSIVYGLVLVPTRELAQQVAREMSMVCKAFPKGRPMKVVSIYGGTRKEEQVEALMHKEPVLLFVAGTPGRLLDLMQECGKKGNKENVSSSTRTVLSLFQGTRFIVLDEADRMAINTDISSQVDSIISMMKGGRGSSRTTCLYSATFPEKVTEKWNTWVSSPKVCMKVDNLCLGGQDASRSPSFPILNVEQCQENGEETINNHDLDEEANEMINEKRKSRVTLDLSKIPAHVHQTLHVCSGHKKPRKLLMTLSKIRKDEIKGDRGRRRGLCIIFFARIKTLNYMSAFLANEGFKCIEMHSQLNQQQRELALSDFKAGKVHILLATDIAARGIHINNVESVINYDFPGTLEQYVHRCGRAGRNRVNIDQQMNSSSTVASANVYSFFTRQLAPMAKDVVSLLRSSNSWIDPNLLQLVDGGDVDSNTEAESGKRRRREKRSTVENVEMKAGGVADKLSTMPVLDNAVDDLDWDDGQFASLSANRVSLKRASHVSDASDSESEEQ